MKRNIVLNSLLIGIYVLISVIFFVIFLCNKSFGQEYASKELIVKPQASKASCEKVNALNELCWENRLNAPDKAIQYGLQALNCAESLKFSNGCSTAYINLAYIYTGQSRFDEAMECYNKAMKALENIFDVKKKKIETARVYEGLGLINYMQRDYDKSVESYQKALKIFRETAMKNNMAVCYRIIGMIYDKSGLEAKAKESYYMESRNVKDPNYSNDLISSYLDFESLKDK